MSRKIPVCIATEIAPGSHRQVDVPDLGAVAVYHVGDQYFITEDSCTHMQASLGEEGTLEGCVIECSWHGGRFDIRTGEVLAPPCPAPLKTYPVALEDGMLYAVVPD